MGVDSLAIAEGWFMRQECHEQILQGTEVLLSLSPRRRTRAQCRARPLHSPSSAAPSPVSCGAGDHSLPSPLTLIPVEWPSR